MDNISIEATDRSPKVDFDFEKGAFLLEGESYPENVSEFYGPVIEALSGYLEGLKDSGGTVEFNFKLIYFNSSSAKVMMGLFDSLDETAEAGVGVTINWFFEDDDDNMEELGEEFGEDLEYAKFNMKPVSA